MQSIIFVNLNSIILILIMILMKNSSRYSLLIIISAWLITLAVKYLKFDTLSMIINSLRLIIVGILIVLMNKIINFKLLIGMLSLRCIS